MPKTNYALSVNGATITATSTYSANRPATAAINGDRTTAGDEGNYAEWHSAAAPSVSAPEGITVNFGASRTIDEINIFTLADTINYTAQPTLSDTFAFYGIIDFTVDYWNGTSWVNISTVQGNNKVWRQLLFTPVTTTQIRVSVTSGGSGAARIVEFEALGSDLTAPTVTSFTAAANSSSQITVSFAAADNVAVTNWDLEFSLDGATNWTALLSNSSAASPYAHTGRSASTRYYYRFRARDAAGNISGWAYADALTLVFALPTTYSIRASGLQLLADAEQSGVGASSFTDSSGNGRTLAATNPKPFIEANVIGGKPAMKFDRTKNPLKYTGQMVIQCGWMLAKSNANFLSYDGLLTALNTYGILVGNSGGNTFFDFGYDLYEYRAGDRIYPASYRYAPIGAFKLIFFRFWKPLIVDGIQLGQDRSDTTRRFDGYVAMMALYSTNYKCEQDIRKDAVSISNYYGLTVSDVYPYQGSKGDQKKLSKIILDDGQVSPVTIIKRGKRKAFDLRFTWRDVAETDYFENFWDVHYPSRRFIYRDYDYVPPRDTMVNIKKGSEPEIKLSGLAPNRFDYSMQVEESSITSDSNLSPGNPGGYGAIYYEGVDGGVG